MSSVALRLTGISKSYGEVSILQDLELEVLQGELFVLLGPSGCGKTTLLRAVAGLVPVERGHIELLGRDIVRTAPEERDVAMVFQDYALYPHMTVWDNLAFGLKRHHVPRDEIQRRIETTTRMLGIEHLLRRKPHQLSGGQQQRVAVGRAIVREPKLFLMDEPLSNLDAQVRANTRAELKELQRRVGVTTLYVTHDQVEAMTLADRLAVMKQGRFEQIGAPLDVYREPATLFVAQFLSSPRLNLLNGTLDSVDGQVVVRTPAATFPLGSTPGLAGDRVQVAIRPEWLRLSLQPVPDAMALDVVLVEPLGAEILVHARKHDVDLVSRTPADRLSPDTRVVWVDSATSLVDLFDMQGRRVALARSPLRTEPARAPAPPQRPASRV